MAKKGIITALSLGLVIILTLMFMWVRADILFPVNTEAWRLDYLLTFIIMAAFIFSFDTLTRSKTESELFRVSFIKAFPKLLLSALITFIGLYLIAFIGNFGVFPSITEGLKGISIGILLAYCLVGAFLEELIFRGWITERLYSRGLGGNSTMIVQSIIFAAFHSLMGKSWVVMIIYFFLGIAFYKIKERFSPLTNMANTGVHLAWNIFILGFIK